MVSLVLVQRAHQDMIASVRQPLEQACEMERRLGLIAKEMARHLEELARLCAPM